MNVEREEKSEDEENIPAESGKTRCTGRRARRDWYTEGQLERVLKRGSSLKCVR